MTGAEYRHEEDLREGDCVLLLGVCKIIARFRKYTGPMDFVKRVAVFTDGTAMSLEEGQYYRTTSFQRKDGKYQ